MSESMPGPGLNRRAFLQGSTLVLSATSLGGQPVMAGPITDTLRVGLVTDLHFADKPAAGTRHYRETVAKLEEAAERFSHDKPSVLVELGDFIDAAASVAVEKSYLRTINRDFAAICGDRHYVLGNHCVDTLLKEEFLSEVEQEQAYYSFDRGGVHFVVLDACFRSDGKPYGRSNSKWNDANIPAEELQWLSEDLGTSRGPVIILAHQRLDVATDHGVKNAKAVRQILESCDRVRVVLQGHSHKNDLKEIGGIHYCTLVAMVEGTGPDNSGYSLLDIDVDGTIRLQGFRQQASRLWAG